MKLAWWLWLMTVVAVGTAAEAPEIARLITQLGAPEFAARQAAQTALINLGSNRLDAVLDQSVHAYARTDDPEVKGRLHDVLQTLVLRYLIDRPRGFLGVQFNRGGRVDGQPPAVEVMAVTADTAAEKAGLQAGDQLLRAGDLELTKDGAADAFVQFIQSKPPGTPLTLEISRGGEKRQLELKLGELPAALRSRLLTPERKQELFQEWLDQALRQAGATRP